MTKKQTLREKIEQELSQYSSALLAYKSWGIDAVEKTHNLKLETAMRIEVSIKEAGWINPDEIIMPGEFETPKAKEILHEWATTNGYRLIPKEEDLPVLNEKEIKHLLSEWPVGMDGAIRMGAKEERHLIANYLKEL